MFKNTPPPLPTPSLRVPEPDLTELLRDLRPRGGGPAPAAGTTPPPREALDAMLPQVYDELRGLAADFLRCERTDHTLQPTALVHEVYLRLAGDLPADWQNRAHFLGIAARLMRRILADSAVTRNALKRGGGATRLALDAALDLSDRCEVSLTGVDEALRALETLDPRQGQIVELRFYGGLTTDEIAEVLGVSAATVKRDWSTAKLWLQRHLDFGAV